MAMEPDKSPAFQFYPSNWLSSANINLMIPAQEGAYIRLLAYMWSDADCSLKDDDETLARLSRLGEDWFTIGSLVRDCFVPHPKKPGFLTSPRLLRERQKQAEWREKSRQAGIKSGQARRNATNQPSKMVQNKTNQKATLQSSSSSSNTTVTAPPNGLNVGALWCDLYRSRHHVTYEFNGGDYNTLKTLNRNYATDEKFELIRLIFKAYLADNDQFVTGQAHRLALLDTRIMVYKKKVAYELAKKLEQEDESDDEPEPIEPFPAQKKKPLFESNGSEGNETT